MSTHFRKSVLLVVASGLAASGCATNGGPMTANQKIAGCAAMVGGGALLGALLGSQVDGRRKGGSGTGAVVGAGLGGAACGVWLAFENEKDKRRIQQAQLDALRSGQAVNRSWIGDDGRQRAVSVVPSTETRAPLKAGGAPDRVCRTVATQPTLNGQSAGAISSVFCRSAQGDWGPA